MSRYNYERGVCWDDIKAEDLSFEQTIERLESYRNIINKILISFEECYADELYDKVLGLSEGV